MSQPPSYPEKVVSSRRHREANNRSHDRENSGIGCENLEDLDGLEVSVSVCVHYESVDFHFGPLVRTRMVNVERFNPCRQDMEYSSTTCS